MSWRQILGAEKRENESPGKPPQYPQNSTRAGVSEDIEDIGLKGAQSESHPTPGPEREPLDASREPEGASLFLGMRLAEFEREGAALEIRVPWHGETLWFVPTEADATVLASRGILRGRIFTAAELRYLMSAPGLTADQVRAVAQVKAEFSGRLTKVRPMGGREA